MKTYKGSKIKSHKSAEAENVVKVFATKKEVNVATDKAINKYAEALRKLADR